MQYAMQLSSGLNVENSRYEDTTVMRMRMRTTRNLKTLLLWYTWTPKANQKDREGRKEHKIQPPFSHFVPYGTQRERQV